jgi:vacuolar-type H+-ATPase subunit E/Vma4
MLENWMEKLMQNAVSAYMPKIESMRESRKAELEALKEAVRSKPEEVEAWFDKELKKLESMNVSDMMSNLH